jgi:hypothetical protein
MKFLGYWKIHGDKHHDVYDMFSKMDLDEYKTQHGSEIKLLGRWHDLMGCRGWGFFETDNQEALNLWITNWTGVCDFEITPVVEDDEAHATMRKYFSKQ